VQLELDDPAVIGPFSVRFEVVLDAALELTLTIANTGDRAVPCQAMLHTYFAVRSAPRTVVHGLEAVPYLPKGGDAFTQDSQPVTIGSGISRRYHDLSGPVTIDDGSRRIQVTAERGTEAVLWNPGAETAAGFDDFPASEWARMLCFETGSLTAEQVEPGGTRTIRTLIRHDAEGLRYQS
jgi:glucose-6-phosphate 1-epimerase